MGSNGFTKLWMIIAKNLTYRKRRWFLTSLQILIPIIIFLSFAFIRSKITKLEKKIVHEAYYNEEYSSEHLYNDKFNHETQIHYTPCNEFTLELMYRVQIKFYLNIEAVKCHQNEKDLLDDIKYNNIPIMAIIFANSSNTSKMSYKIRPYQEHVLWNTNNLYKTSLSYTPDLGSATYLYQGFLATQMALETSYIEIVTNEALPVKILLQEFPYPPHTDKSGIMDMHNYVLPLATLLSFIFSSAAFVPRIIEDKVSGMKEFLKINGVRSWMILVGWFLDEFLLNLLVTTCITVFLKHPVFPAGTPPIEYCEPTLLFAFLTLYSISTITFSMALSSLFTKSTYSCLIAMIVWILTYIIPNCLVCPNIKLNGNLLFGLFPNALLVFGFKILSVYEMRETKATWINIFDAPSGGAHELPLGGVFIMFFISTVLHLLFSVLGELFLPGPYGVPMQMTLKKPNLNCMEKKSQRDIIPEYRIQIENLITSLDQKENCDLPVSIRIKNLSKRFGQKTVVDNVSIDIYDEQITVLLGKNGAGKTTMLSVITGMLNASSGTVTFTHGGNTSISFCPQHNLQFTSLTVKEHLNFFGKVKGLSAKKAKYKSKELLELMNLTNKKNEYVSNLSEGMRRKLSLAIAVIGDSRVIILDEPSSGLDPEVRRDIWNFIITLRGFRTLIVTTHLMEEAEALSDRIIIVNDGSILDYGSPLYLSKKYGVGYKIHVGLKDRTTIDKIFHAVGNVGKIELSTDSMVNILFDKFNKEYFISVLKILEDHKDDFHIEYVNFTHTSLEDVFMNAIKSVHKQADEATGTEKEEPNTQELQKINRCSFFILLKKWILFTKWSILFLQIITLILFMVSIIFLCQSNSRIIPDDSSFEFKLNKYEQTNVFYSSNANKLYERVPTIYSNLVKEQFSNVKNVDNVTEAIINEGLKNIEFYKKYMVVSAEFTTRDGHNVAKAMYSNNAIHGSSISLTLLLNTLLKNLAGDHYSITSSIKPLPYESENKIGHVYTIQLTSIWCILLPFAMTLIASLFIVVPHMERVSSLKQLQIMCGVSRKQYWFTCYLWNLTMYIIVVFISLSVIYLANTYISVSNIITIHELVAIFVILLAYGATIIPYSFLYTFIGSTTASIGIFVIVNLFTSQIMMIFILYLETSNDNYLEDMSKKIVHLLNFFPAFGLQHTIAEFVEKFIWNYNWNRTPSENKEAICNSNYNPCCDNNIQRCNQYQSYFNNDIVPILYGILEILASTLLYILILVLVEIRLMTKIKQFVYNVKSRSFRNQPRSEESLLSRRSVSESESTNSKLEVKNLIKKYGSKEVLNEISFNTTPNYECLGLLGANGAGKTTISRLLSQEETPNSGQITRYDSENKLVKDQNKFGYCPQIDCSTSLASGKRLLELFGLLRGVKDVDKEVARLMDTFDLKKISNNLCSTYSGGNKRKLNTAIALIGGPNFIVLDEPTAGVDPVSRQKMRNELNFIKQRSSMIINTHIVEDCEVVCNKVAILKKGKILKHGTISELKNSLNQIVTVKLKINSKTVKNNDLIINKKNKIIKDMIDWIIEEPEDVKQLKEGICDIFNSCNLEDQHAGLLKYNIAAGNSRYNEVFRKVEALQRQHSVIEDYEITSTTLEDVFHDVSTKE